MSWLKLNRNKQKIYQKSMAVFLSAMLLITSLITFFPGMGGVAEADFLTYTVANIDDQTLAALTEGYTSGSQETKTITITRTGTGDLTNLATALSGTNAGDFEITQPADSTLNVITPSATLAVKARDGLTAGTYTATVTISADNMTDVTFAVNQAVNGANNGYYTWVEVGSARFSAGKAWYPSIAVAGNGTPFVVFRDESNGDKATVMKYDGANWVVVGNAGFSAGKAEHTSIALDSQNTPYVVYQDVGNNYKATVMKYNGSNWEVLGSAGFSAGKVTLTSIAIDSDDKPYVVYQDWGNGQKATVMQYTGTAWEAVGSAGFSTGIAWTLSLALDSSNTPYVAYTDAANDNKATVMTYDGAAWVAVGSAGFSADEAGYINIAIDGPRTPYVVYEDKSNDNKATVMKFNGTGWELVGSPGFSVGSAAATDIAIDNGTPYVAYQGNSDSATVMKYTGINWEEIGSASLSDYSGFIRIAMDSSATLYVVIQEKGSDKVTVLKYGWLAHTYAIAPIEDRTLPVLNEGYAGSQRDFHIQIEKIGTGPLNNLGTALSGANAAAFEITQPFVTTLNDATPNTQFTVKAKDGLTIGTYAATVTVTADSMTAVTFTVTQEVVAGDYAIAAIDDQVLPVLTEGYAGSQQWRYIYVWRTGASQLTNLATAISGDDADAFEMTQPVAEASDQSNFAIKTKDGLAAGAYTATVTVTADYMTPVTFTVTQVVMGQSIWQWSNVGSAGFSTDLANEIKLAIDKNDTLYVVYSSSVFMGSGNRATVMQYDEISSSWVVVGSAGFSAGVVSSPNIAIDSSGTPYVVYRDEANGNKVTVMKYDGTSWVVVGSVGFSAGAGRFPNIAIDSNGTPYVVYQDSSNASKATVMKYDGTSWVVVGSPGFSAGTVGSPNIVMDSNDMPYVAFSEGPASFKTTVMKYNGSNWVAVGSTRFSAGSVTGVSMALDSNDTPYVVYGDGDNEGKATVMQYNGTSWELVGDTGFSYGKADYTSIAIDDNNIPYVAYQDHNTGQKATAMKYDETSSSWVVMGKVGFSEGGMQDISIAIDSHNTPYVAYRDWARGNKATVMKYAASNYTVTYDGNGHTGGSVPSDSNSPYNESAQVTVLANTGNLVKDGYTFTGWNTAANGSGAGYAPGATFAMGAVNVTLFAQWTVLPAEPPAAQPTNLTFSTTPDNDIVLAFTASQTASNYLIVRRIGGEQTFVPVNETGYSAGLQGADEILSVGSGHTYTDAAAQVDQDYYYTIYAFNGSGAGAAYLTIQPLKGRIKLQSGETNAEITVDATTNLTSAGFSDAGVNITFPEGAAQATSLTVSKAANQPAANFYVQPNVRRVSPLYFEIGAAPQEPGNYILTLDFASLGLAADQWNNFVVLKRAAAGSPWVNIENLGAAIVNRQTDGVWGKFTISGLSSFSQFAGGERAESHTVTSAADAGAGTLRGVLEQAVAGDIIQFDVAQMGASLITLTSPIVIDKDITIRGAGNGIVLDGNNATRVLTIADGAVVRLESIRIQNGNDDANVVGGILNEGQLTLVNTVVSGNEATGVVAGFGGVGGILQEVESVIAGGFPQPIKLVLINSTIAGNAGADSNGGVGGLLVLAGEVEIYNSIIYGNTGADADAYFDAGIDKSYNSLYSFADSEVGIGEGSNNLFAADPLFAGTGGHPYQLSAGSPAIDAGNNSYIYEQFDVRGEGFARKINGADGSAEGTVDIGAYEYVPGAVTQYTVAFDSNGGSAVTSQVVDTGSTVTEPAAPTREGYTFNGWYSDSGLTTLYNYATTATDHITLYAGWTANHTREGTALWAWGINSAGQLGDGTTDGKTTPTRIGNDTDWASVATGGEHTVAIKEDGSLWAWGYNGDGQLGDGTTADKTTPTKIGDDSNWASVATGGEHTVAIKEDGSLWAWGYNGAGQLGDGTTADKTTPTKIGDDSNWASVAAGVYYTVAIKEDGSLWAWGRNNYGQLGDSTMDNRNTPTRIGNDIDWASVAAGGEHTGAIKEDGSLWAWGYNEVGQLGDGTMANRNTPTRIGNDTDWASVAAGRYHTVALKTAGSLWVWGYNGYGQLGDSTTADKTTPTRIGNDTDWAFVAAGGNYTVAFLMVPTYTVTYDGNGATGGSVPADTANYEEEATITVVGNTGILVISGYTFAGWNTVANGTGTGYAAGNTFAMGTANVTLYAVWTANPTYTVTYDGNGATGGSVPADTNNYEEGATVTVLGNTGTMVRTGYTFADWNTAANGTGYAAGNTFAMGTANVTLYARWNAISSGDDTTPTPPPTTETREEIIRVDVETGNRGEGAVILQTPIKRTTDPSGFKQDEVTYNAQLAKETIQVVKESGQNTARIVIPDSKDEVSQVNVVIPKEAAGEFAKEQINLEVFTDNARIVVPQTSLQNLNVDIFFRVIPIKEEAQRREVAELARAEQIVLEISQGREVSVVARPMTIETNLQNRAVDLILPLRDVILPENAVERAKFLAELAVFIQHSDGERVLVRPTMVTYAGQANELGLQFRINKFSTFTIVHLEGWQDEQHLHQAYVSGYPDGTFQPDRAVTRAEMAAMLARNVGLDNERKQELATPIPDVPPAHWASAAIAYMQELGLMQGDPNGNFRPDDAISRAEIATLAARYKDLTVNKDIQNSVIFSDVTNHWAAGAIDAAQQAGLLHGYPDGAYRPGKSLTRAEAVTFVNRLFSRGPFYGVATASWQDAPTTHWAFADIEEASQDHYYIITEAGYEMLQN